MVPGNNKCSLYNIIVYSFLKFIVHALDSQCDSQMMMSMFGMKGPILHRTFALIREMQRWSLEQLLISL